MTLQFKLRRANRRRTFRKFRRCKLKDWDSTHAEAEKYLYSLYQNKKTEIK